MFNIGDEVVVDQTKEGIVIELDDEGEVKVVELGDRHWWYRPRYIKHKGE